MKTWSEDLVFLAENEYGFSPTALGFPSISACRAIVYQTSDGLFGFHQACGAFPDRFAEFGEKFAAFVRGHPEGRDIGLSSIGMNMYVVSKLGMGGSYSIGDAGAREHRAELKAFAGALGFKGNARSYDLSSKWPGQPGVYVEFVVHAATCLIYANPWIEHHDPAHKAPGGGAGRVHHQLSYPSSKDFIAPDKVFTKVETTARQRLEPITIELGLR